MREILVLMILVYSGCATAPPAEPPPAPLPPSEPPGAASPDPQGSGDATSVDGHDGLLALCESLRDESFLTFPGNAVEHAQAFEAHAQRRQAALAGRYVSTVPAFGFGFRKYDSGARRLRLDTGRSLEIGDGAELFVTHLHPEPAFVLAPDVAERLRDQREEGKVALRLIFSPLASQLRKDGCMSRNGRRVVMLEIEVLGAALLAPDGSVLARADAGEHIDPSLAGPVRSPTVGVRKPRAADGKVIPPALAASLATLAENAQPCYQRALLARPALRGDLVLGILVGTGGRVESAHVEMSSLGDDTLAACVATHSATAILVGTSAGQRFSVPLEFRSAEEK